MRDSPYQSPLAQSKPADSTQVSVSPLLRVGCLVGFWVSLALLSIVGLVLVAGPPQEPAFGASQTPAIDLIAVRLFEDLRWVLLPIVPILLLAAWGFRQLANGKDGEGKLRISLLFYISWSTLLLKSSTYLYFQDGVTIFNNDAVRSATTYVYGAEVIWVTLLRQAALGLSVLYAIPILLVRRRSRQRQSG